MTSPTGKSVVYRFGVFTANADTGELLKKGVRVKLQDQPFRLLCLLLEKSGGIVSKEDVRERLWPGNTFVEFDASLSVAVGKLRDALGDDSDNPRFIETVPRKGIASLLQIERVPEEPAVGSAPIPLGSSPEAIPPASAAHGKSHSLISTIDIKRALLICGVAILLRWRFLVPYASQAVSIDSRGKKFAERSGGTEIRSRSRISQPARPQGRRLVVASLFRNGQHGIGRGRGSCELYPMRT